MSKYCCWASNDPSRDKEDYIKCSNKSKKPENDGKKKKQQICCADAFRMKQQAAMEQYKADMQPFADPCGKRSNKDKFRCFVAKMICMKLNMPGQEFKCPEQLSIVADICKGCKPLMCADRINVNCFPSEPSAQFSMLQECFERELDSGIQLKVIYMQREIGKLDMQRDVGGEERSAMSSYRAILNKPLPLSYAFQGQAATCCPSPSYSGWSTRLRRLCTRPMLR